MGTTRSRYGGAATFVGVVADTMAKKFLKALSLLVAVASGAPLMTEVCPRDQNGGSRAYSLRDLVQARLSSSVVLDLEQLRPLGGEGPR